MSKDRPALWFSRLQPTWILAAALLLGSVAVLANNVPVQADEPGLQVGDVTVAQGLVYEDLNENGSPDAGEAGIAGVAVWMRKLPGGTAVVPYSTTTNAVGQYQVITAPLDAGDYLVTIDIPRGYVPTTRRVVTDTLAYGETFYADFGLREGYRMSLPMMLRNWSRQ